MGHSFILEPSQWEGKGVITLSMAEDVIPYTMTWTVFPHTHQKILLHQVVTIQELDQVMTNKFCVTNLCTAGFEIELSNDVIYGVKGKGLIDRNVIAWEFRQVGQDFEGFEIYRLQDDGSYDMRAEYASSDGMRTRIEGCMHPLKLK